MTQIIASYKLVTNRNAVEKWVTVPLKGVTMEKINLPFFSNLGASLNRVAWFQYAPEFRPLLANYAYRLSLGLRVLIESFPTLRVCRQACTELISTIGETIEHYNAILPDWQKEDVESDDKFSNVIVKAQQFEVILNAELETLDNYHVTRKGIYDTNSLIERAEYIFPIPVLKKISGDVVVEIREAGKCLAFDCATASGFHIVRAIETVMHQFYIAICKPESDEKLENWGAYISAFRGLVDNGSIEGSVKENVKRVISLLQQIKDQDRNLIMHPELVLSPDEALILFEIAKGAIIAMVDKLPKDKKKKG